jgi:hypothetical protein
MNSLDVQKSKERKINSSHSRVFLGHYIKKSSDLHAYISLSNLLLGSKIKGLVLDLSFKADKGNFQENDYSEAQGGHGWMTLRWILRKEWEM